MNGCFQNTGYIEEQLSATSSTDLYAFMTRWYLATGVDSIRLVMRVRNSSANFETRPFIQTASIRPDEPDAPDLLGAPQSGSSVDYVLSQSVAAYTADKMWFRLGVTYKSNSGVTQGDVGLQATWTQVAGIVDARMVQLQANDTGDRYAVLTRWFPAIYATKIKVAYSVTGVSGSNLRFKTACQVAPYSVQQPFLL